MKFLVVLALAAIAAAEPEADPFYSIYGAGYGTTAYTAGVYNPLTTTYAGVHHPATYTAGVYGYPATYTAGVYGYPYVTKVVKREAEAESEPYFGYAGVYSPYTVATPHVYSQYTAGVVPYAHHAGVVPYAYHPYAYLVQPKSVSVQKDEGAPVGYKAINAGAAHIVNKREAESKPYYYNTAFAYSPYSAYTAGVVPAHTYANTYAGVVPAYSGYSAYSYPYIY